jgi:hypothetical protein
VLQNIVLCREEELYRIQRDWCIWNYGPWRYDSVTHGIIISENISLFIWRVWNTSLFQRHNCLPIDNVGSLHVQYRIWLSLGNRMLVFYRRSTSETWLSLRRYEGVSKSFRTGRLGPELQMIQLSAIRCRCIAILWVSLVSFAAITLCVASQRVFVVVVVISLSTQSGNFWIHPRIIWRVPCFEVLNISIQRKHVCSYVPSEHHGICVCVCVCCSRT